MAYYFISDLHLQADNKAKIKALLQFLDDIHADANALYILGDYFEYWIGDDNRQHGLDEVIDAMRQFAVSTPLYFMRGNRDFLIGNQFAQQCHLHLLDDPHVINIGQQNILLMHGDLLCTDDHEYFTFRAMTRTTEWQQNFCQKSVEERINIAEGLRQQSKKAMQNKTDAIMDVNEATVTHYFESNHLHTMIHGHTHRPAIHRYRRNNQNFIRFVLSDWHTTATYLKISADRYVFVSPNVNEQGMLTG